MADEGVLAVMVPQLELLLPELDEKGRRLVLGAVARAAGEGGTGAVARLTGASWQTVADGAAELGSGLEAAAGRVRRPGGGRRRLADSDPGLVPALLALVEDSVRGDPQSPLVWTTKSAERLAGELAGLGHRCGGRRCGGCCGSRGSRCSRTLKVKEGGAPARGPGRPVPVHFRAGEGTPGGGAAGDQRGRQEEGAGRGVRQAGGNGRAQGSPARVRDHSFPGPGGHAIPYGIYDIAANAGFINVGTGANTAALAVASVRRWWEMIGRNAYPQAARLLVTCDAGGSNGWQNRGWKKGLAQFAQDAGLQVTVCHFPPGTSKWNKVEHRLFSQVSHAWRGRP